MSVPPDSKDAAVDATARQIPTENVDASPNGMLFLLVTAMAHDYHSRSTFATVYDDVAAVLPIAIQRRSTMGSQERTV